MSVRTIEVTITGEFISKDTKNAGVQGEGNVTSLHIVMDETWKDYGKRIVWRDALGENPVAVILYNEIDDLLAGVNPLEFDTTIPSEPLALAGWCSFTIEGYFSDEPGSVAYSVTDHLLVKPNEQLYQPAEPTAGQALQLQAEIEKIIPQVTALVEGAMGSLEDTEREMSVWEPWDREREYQPLNKVAWQGRSFICVYPHRGVDPLADTAPSGVGLFWLLIADKGDRGEQGLQGVTGPPGPQGVAGFTVETSGAVAFNVDEYGHLWVYSTGEEATAYFIDENGHLCYQVS